MDIKEFLQLLSVYHRLLILLGGVICLISLFLPAWAISRIETESTIIYFSGTLSVITFMDEWFFFIYLVLILGLFYGYFKRYGEEYPYIYGGVGILIFLLTLVSTPLYAGDLGVTPSYGFFFELFGAVIISVGGYYYYMSTRLLA